mmetsp:Transcript_117165/g.303993  ORF Transcript_117165/g.303993 Transcript_117165/m.303993 type:complete len:487 (+) Transcript_117165:55-1515(+)
MPRDRKKALATSRVRCRGPWHCAVCSFRHSGALVTCTACKRCGTERRIAEASSAATQETIEQPLTTWIDESPQALTAKASVSHVDAQPPSNGSPLIAQSGDLVVPRAVAVATASDAVAELRCGAAFRIPSAVAGGSESDTQQVGESVVYSEFVWQTPTKRCPHLSREDIQRSVSDANFGRRLCGRNNNRRVAIYDLVAALAKRSPVPKHADVVSKSWFVEGDRFLQQRVNLQPRKLRRSFRCLADVYDYSTVPAGTLIVDFANKKVGGGCFGGGFVQEEQMVAQSTDFAARLHRSREVLAKHQAASYEGVHMDAWWDFEACATKENLDNRCVQHKQSAPLTILAVDAPVMRNRETYGRSELYMLAKKVTLIFAAASTLEAPLIFSGLLGGGAFRNNRPLVLLLHLLLQPCGDERPLWFHHPVFWSFGGVEARELEHHILHFADVLLEDLQRQGVATLGEALELILASALPLSESDGDLAQEPRLCT